MEETTTLPEIVDSYIQRLIAYNVTRQMIIGFIKNNPTTYANDILDDLNGQYQHDYCFDDIQNYLLVHLV